MKHTIDEFLRIRTDDQIVMSEALDLLCDDHITLEQYMDIMDIAQDPVELAKFMEVK